MNGEQPSDCDAIHEKGDAHEPEEVRKYACESCHHTWQAAIINKSPISLTKCPVCGSYDTTHYDLL